MTRERIIKFPLTQHDFWWEVGCFAYFQHFPCLVSFWCMLGGSGEV